MPWLEETYTNYKKGYVSYRIRVWGSDKHGNKVKKTVKTFRIPLILPCIDKFRLSNGLACYLFSPITIDSLENPGFFTQITLNDDIEKRESVDYIPDDMKSVWLSGYPREKLEQFLEGNENRKEQFFICGREIE